MSDTRRLTADIVSAFVAGNQVATATVPELIVSVSRQLAALANGSGGASPLSRPAATWRPETPAVPITQSILPDRIICLDCGMDFKTLRRHLLSVHRTTADEYRARWRLPADYPVVSPDYAKTRSTLAKASGLGRRGR